MSLRGCLKTVKGLLADDARGLKRNAEYIAIVENLDVTNVVPRKITFGRWKLAGQIAPGGEGRMVIRPARSEIDAATFAQGDEFDAAHDLSFMYEHPVHSDMDAIEDHVTVMFAALVRSLRQLPEYSRETGGTIYEIDGRIVFSYGEYAPIGAITTGGFTASARVLEQSSL